MADERVCGELVGGMGELVGGMGNWESWWVGWEGATRWESGKSQARKRS